MRLFRAAVAAVLQHNSSCSPAVVGSSWRAAVSRGSCRFNSTGKGTDASIQFNLAGVKKLSHKVSWSDWLTTTPGRKMVAGVVGVGGSIAIVVTIFAAEVTGLDITKEQYEERKTNAEPMTIYERLARSPPESYPLPPQLIRLAAQNSQRSGLTEKEEDKVELFNTFLLDPVVWGTTYSGEGAVVGFPRYMMATNKDDIDLSGLRIKPCWNKFFPGYSIPPETDAALQDELRESLYLSEGAQAFIVSKSLARAGDFQGVCNVLLPGVWWFYNYIISVNINQGFKLMSHPRYFRLAVQSVWYCCSISLFCLLHNAVKYWTETNAIAKVCTTSEEVEHALEYYNKGIERNLVLHKIINGSSESEADYYFTEAGDLVPNFYEMLPAVSLTAMKEYCQDLLKEKSAN